MRDNNTDSKMAEPKVAFAPDARVPRAIAVLSALQAEQITQLMIARLARQCDQERGLPPCCRDEDPEAIFVDVIRGTRDRKLADTLRFACVQALRQEYFETAPNPEVLGGLCHLAAVIGAVEARDFLPNVVEDERSERLILPDGETVRSRALRAWVGLLGASPGRSPDVRRVLEGLLRDAQYRHLALTGLIGLWPESRKEFLAMVPAGQINEQHLNMSLDLAGFGSSVPAVQH